MAILETRARITSEGRQVFSGRVLSSKEHRGKASKLQFDDGARDDMAYWLMKSEPGTWSWDDQVRDGVAEWDGVRNYQAANNMKAMALGDCCFFYHSVSEKSVVGIVEVVRLYYPDPSDPSGRFGMVDVKALRPMTRPVSLAEIKAEPRLADLPLIRQSRLSVLPVSDAQWRIICEMGETKP